MTVSSTRNEIKADRDHHLSKADQKIVLRERKEAQTEISKLMKKEKQGDRSHETDQRDHLEKEEEANTDLESMSEIGHVHAEGQMHHVHGHKAKNPKAKEKGKMLNPKAKTTRAKAKCKDRRTSKTFQTKLMNGTMHFANIARAKTWQIVVGNMKFSNALDWSTTTQIVQGPTSAKMHSDIWTS